MNRKAKKEIKQKAQKLVNLCSQLEKELDNEVSQDLLEAFYKIGASIGNFNYQLSVGGES